MLPESLGDVGMSFWKEDGRYDRVLWVEMGHIVVSGASYGVQINDSQRALCIQEGYLIPEEADTSRRDCMRREQERVFFRRAITVHNGFCESLDGLVHEESGKMVRSIVRWCRQMRTAGSLSSSCSRPSPRLPRSQRSPSMLAATRTPPEKIVSNDWPWLFEGIVTCAVSGGIGWPTSCGDMVDVAVVDIFSASDQSQINSKSAIGRHPTVLVPALAPIFGPLHLGVHHHMAGVWASRVHYGSTRV